MNSPIRAIAGVGLLALALGLGTSHWLNQAKGPGADAAKALLTTPMVDLQNQSFSLDRYQGKVLVVNFWATWCPPCREEIPHFIEVQENLKEKGVQFAGIALDQPAMVTDFLRYYPINYPVLMADESIGQIMRDIGNPTGGLPYTLVYDRRGQLKEKIMGRIDKPRLQELLAPLI